MKTSTLPVCCLLILFLVAISGYNTKKCDDKPTETGPCKAMFLMWRFIKVKNQCESFIYGGCMATRNMFDAEEECKAQCLS